MRASISAFEAPAGRRASGSNRAGRGIALITTLAILSLVTILLVAFTSVTLSDRQSTHSYSQGMAADQIGQSGLAAIVNQLEAEITDTNNPAKMMVVTNGAVAASANFPIYCPLTNTALGPERMSILPSDPNLSTLVKISEPGANFYTTTAAAGTNFASSASTTAPSLNGRSISVALWNAPMLVPASSATNFPVPNWILVGRNGPVVPAPGRDLSIALGNTNAILGRYAYVVYDVSGLIDINVAGYPQGASTEAGNKGLLPWADLTQLTNAISQSDVTALVNWRNAANAANYAAYVTNTWPTNGFMRVAPGDTAFMDRQELIQYARTQNYDLTNALPYLTTFSREVNGPVWRASADAPYGAPFDYYTHRLGTTTTTKSVPDSYGSIVNPAPTIYNNNVFILNPRIQTAYTNAFGLLRQAGEPLVKYRFPLDKLALLATTTNAAAWAQNQTAIQQYFGLDYDASDSTGFYRHWSYPTTNPAYNYNSVTNRILTLDEVAKLQRDPNFFELLQAGILSGSLGKGGRGDYTANPSYATSYPDPDTSLPYQLIRIGANIIDQWSSDSCPTAITFNSHNFYGIKDLPYIDKVFFKAYLKTSSSVVPLVYFELWNPHQNTGNSPSASRPVNFRIMPYGNDQIYNDVLFYGSYGGATGTFRWSTPVTITNLFSSLPNGGAITFSAAATDYREPSLMPASKGSPSIPQSELLNTNPGSGSDRNVSLLGLTLPTIATPSTGWDSGPVGSLGVRMPWPPSEPWYCEFGMPSSIFLLQYEWPVGSGKYHTYSTLSGLETTPAVSVSQWGLYTDTYANPTSGASANSYGFAKSDPRTVRWSLQGFQYAVPPGDTPQMAGNSLLPSASSSYLTYNNIQVGIPFTGGLSTPPYREDLWAANTNSVASTGTNPYYKDLDAAQRIGDAAFSAPEHLPPYVGDSSRPVILNRPFTSVGDLGNAYRDMPWKTLNFFSADTADAALLDLYTLSDGPVVAGRVNPNSAPLPVLRALLSGAALDAYGASALSPSSVGSVASAFQNTATNSGFYSRADIVSKFMNDPSVAGVSSANLKTEREAVIRALAEPANTRTWNLMIDLVAQSGQYPAGTTAPENFMVEGTRRYWLHIAIDRYTGEVVDRELEVVGD